MFQRHGGKKHKKCTYAFSFFVGKHREPQSINAKLFLPIIPIGIVAYAFTLFVGQLLSKQLYPSATPRLSQTTSSPSFASLLAVTYLVPHGEH